MRLLTESSANDSLMSIFPTMRELVCFAAVLGFQIDKKLPLDKETHEIDSRIFESHDVTKDLIYLIALADTRDQEVLREENDDRCIEIFEEYSEGGLEEIALWLKERPEDPAGNKAILDALQNRGFLEHERDVDIAITDVQF